MMILEELAKRYPQLYLTPGDNMLEEYRNVVLKGKIPDSLSLELFHGTSLDDFFTEDTPAGAVDIIYLHDRQDFENFLRIMCYRCSAVEIPSTTGAMTLSGVINRDKIRRHKGKYLLSGGDNWPLEWKLFSADKKNYTDTLIIISNGAYSNVPYDKTGYPEEEWMQISRMIRTYHECTHVICRRLYPDLRDAIWDEVVADAIGILFAVNEYDVKLAEMFLGVSTDGYTGGRLENYLSEEEKTNMNEIAIRTDRLIHQIREERDRKKEESYYQFLKYLEENRGCFEQIY